MKNFNNIDERVVDDLKKRTKSTEQVKNCCSIIVLRNRNNAMNIDKQNRLHPFYLVYIAENGEIISNHFNLKNSR